MSLMKECEWSGCHQWAQWVASYPLPSKIKRLLCNVHQVELAKENDSRAEDRKIKFLFAGAIPSGIDHTKY
jgi:hypothetical protein